MFDSVMGSGSRVGGRPENAGAHDSAPTPRHPLPTTIPRFMLSPEFRRELRQLVTLAAPIAAAQAGTQLMTLVDLAVLGRLGAREIAAAGLANAIFFALSVTGMGV